MSSVLPAHASAPLSAATRPFGIAAVPGVETPLGGGEQSEQNFSFGDFLSVINPLQHIPIVGTIYRAVTGDTLAPAARVIGGTLFGGPIGLVASAFNAMIEQTTGKDLGDKALALLAPDAGKPAPAAVQYASAPTATAAPVPAPAPAPAVTPATAAAPPANPFVETSAAETAPTPGAPPPANAERAVNLARSNSFKQPATDGSNAAPGRTLADYRSFAGRALPTVDSTRSTTASTPVRLQTTGPMTPERGRTPVTPTSTPTDSPATAPTNGQTNDSSASAQQTHWFNAAMMKGLDRYRDSRRAEPAPQVDTSL